MKQIQDALQHIGIPIMAGVWRATSPNQNPPVQYVVYSSTMTEDAHQDGHVQSFRIYTLTGGAYGKYQRTRAAINRPFKYAKHPPTLMGCLISIMMLLLLPTVFITLIIGLLL